MEWSLIFELISSKLMLVVAVCWCLGFILKRTPFVPDWTIVYFVMAVSLALVMWMEGVKAESVVQGILCGSFSVYGHQLVKQTKERDRD